MGLWLHFESISDLCWEENGYSDDVYNLLLCTEHL